GAGKLARWSSTLAMRWSGALLVLALVACAGPIAAPPVPTATLVPAPPPTAVPVPTPVPTPTTVPVVLEPRTPAGDYFLGRADAPIALEIFGDFQCPVCGEFARTVE